MRTEKEKAQAIIKLINTVIAGEQFQFVFPALLVILFDLARAHPDYGKALAGQIKRLIEEEKT
jgi:hypothetical protein